MIEAAWYIAIAIAALVVMGDWRRGLYCGILADCLRDPVRKLAEGEPILITLTGAGLWILIVVVALVREKDEIALLFDRYPRIKTVLGCVTVAIVPAAALSCLLYNGGWQIALVGLASYGGPLLGIAVGYALAQSEREIYRLFAFYSIVNSLLLVGVPLEYLNVDVAGLGGLKDAEWVRYHDGYTVKLIAGFYRSPDIMGLHAAHTVMFSAMLAIRSQSLGRYGWIGLIMWATICMLLCGRRKMVGIPLVFLAAYLGLGMLRGIRHINALIGGSIVTALASVAVLLVVFDRGGSDEYTEYATTIFTQGAGRANELILGSSIGTLQQVGILGGGLGTATQGRYYLRVQTSRSRRGWQEDGVSRMLMEFGVPGAILMFVAAFALMRTLYGSFWLVDAHSPIQTLQIGAMSIVLANAASFAISHQQYSGDPISALFATILAGIVLGAPRIFAKQTRAMASRRQSPPEAVEVPQVALAAQENAR